jgi:hypothetical protein
MQFCGRVRYSATRKNLESRMKLDEPVECASGGDSLLFIKFCIYCFLYCTNSLHTTKKRRKNYQHYLDAGPLEFQFLRPRGYLTNPLRTLVALFRGYRQNSRSHLS